MSLTQNGMSASAEMVPWATRARKMTPMVFCASLVPWARETSEAEPIWPSRKPLSLVSSPTLEVMR